MCCTWRLCRSNAFISMTLWSGPMYPWIKSFAVSRALSSSVISETLAMLIVGHAAKSVASVPRRAYYQRMIRTKLALAAVFGLSVMPWGCISLMLSRFVLALLLVTTTPAGVAQAALGFGGYYCHRWTDDYPTNDWTSQSKADLPRLSGFSAISNWLLVRHRPKCVTPT